MLVASRVVRNLRRALLSLAVAACGRSGADPPGKEIHLERWDAGGLPVVGDIDVTVRGFDAGGDLSTATGTVELVCDPCVIEGTKIPFPTRPGRSSAFAGEAVTFPRVDLGMVRGTLTLNNGRGTIEGHAAGGPALEIELSGTIAFAANLAESESDLRLVLRPAADLAATSPQLSSILLILGPADGGGAVSVEMKGPLGRLRPVSRR
jgi:type II secretion system protein N